MVASTHEVSGEGSAAYLDFIVIGAYFLVIFSISAYHSRRGDQARA